MRIVLHILTRPDDELAWDIIERQQRSEGHSVVVTDLSEPRPDYKDLLEKIFSADTVQTW